MQLKHSSRFSSPLQDQRINRRLPFIEKFGADFESFGV